MAQAQPPAMTAEERGAHIQSCSDHFLAAYHWMHLRDQALREKVNDEGVDYFQVMGARHAAELRQEGAAHG